MDIEGESQGLQEGLKEGKKEWEDRRQKTQKEGRNIDKQLGQFVSLMMDGQIKRYLGRENRPLYM